MLTIFSLYSIGIFCKQNAVPISCYISRDFRAPNTASKAIKYLIFVAKGDY